ncbi:hypothetical protein KY346_00730 [Candidatus Woesearchaeota archaeon]|nr:hypothetical protein [Candidatus Woesearchaeota archaeon]
MLHTTIQISINTKNELEKFKQGSFESWDKVINRLLNLSKAIQSELGLKTIQPSIEEMMRINIQKQVEARQKKGLQK